MPNPLRPDHDHDGHDGVVSQKKKKRKKDSWNYRYYSSFLAAFWKNALPPPGMNIKRIYIFFWARNRRCETVFRKFPGSIVHVGKKPAASKNRAKNSRFYNELIDIIFTIYSLS